MLAVGGPPDGEDGFRSSKSRHEKAADGNVRPTDLLNAAQEANQVQLGPWPAPAPELTPVLSVRSGTF